MDIVCIRQSVDWANMTKEKFLSQYFPYAQNYWNYAKNKVFETMKIWDENLNISYFDYRAELKKITFKNLKLINCDIIENNYIDFKKYSLFIPMDDDDWLSPDVFEEIKRHQETNKNVDVFFWNHTTLNWNGEIKIYKEKKLFSNNFAITNKGLKKIINLKNKEKFKDSVAIDPLYPHYYVHRRIFKTKFSEKEGELPKINEEFKIYYIDKQLNISNKSICSVSEILKSNDIIKNIKYIKEKKIKNYLWANSSIKHLNSLNKFLKIKKII